MKKIIALLLSLACLVSLISCKRKTKYEPVESTEEENTTVMTLTIGEDTYEVKYELYRMFFLNYKSMVDGGNAEVWNGAEKEKYIAEIDKIIISRITEIYSAFAVCKSIGFDLYSKEVDEKIEENIKISVEGGSYGNKTIEGYGSYENYLASLKSMNMNYAVMILLFRYAIAIDAIDSHYIGTVSSDDVDINMTIGAISYTRDDVKAFYDSDDCVRVLSATFQTAIATDPEKKAESIKEKLLTAAASKSAPTDKETAVFLAIMNNSALSGGEEVRRGKLIGRYNLDRAYYGEMTDAAFALEPYAVSDGIRIVTDVEDSYYILYRADKSDTHFNDNYESIKYIYLTNYVGKILHDTALTLTESVQYTDFLKSVNHTVIGM